MEIRSINPINFLFFRASGRMDDLGGFVQIGQELIVEAVSQRLFITGPLQWHYFNFTRRGPFDLEIALPVSEVVQDYDGRFHFKRTEVFKCVAARHEGTWEALPESYNKMLAFISERRLRAVSANREVYINVDLRNPQANITEIQIGIDYSIG